MDYMQILSSSALGDDDNGDAVTGSDSMGTFSASSYRYDSEEEQNSTAEDSKTDTKQVIIICS